MSRETGALHDYLSIPAVVSFDNLQKLLLLGLLVGALRDLVEWQGASESVVSDP